MPYELFSGLTNRDANQEISGSQRFVIFSLSGLFSGLITCIVATSGWALGPYGIGSVFGMCLGIALAANRIIKVWEVLLFPVPAAALYYLSFCAVGVTEFILRIAGASLVEVESVSLLSVFAGGVFGGGLLLCGISCLVYPDPPYKRIILKCVPWSLVSGVLGVVGWALGPLLGMFVASTNSQANTQYSTFIIWQTGMALVLGVVLEKLSPKQ